MIDGTHATRYLVSTWTLLIITFIWISHVSGTFPTLASITFLLLPFFSGLLPYRTRVLVGYTSRIRCIYHPLPAPYLTRSFSNLDPFYAVGRPDCATVLPTEFST